MIDDKAVIGLLSAIVGGLVTSGFGWLQARLKARTDLELKEQDSLQQMYRTILEQKDRDLERALKANDELTERNATLTSLLQNALTAAEHATTLAEKPPGGKATTTS